MTHRLALVRHSIPTIDETVPACEWRLSEDGRARCPAAVEVLHGLNASRIYTSDEPKAIETAQVIGNALKVPIKVAEGLHEHERPRLPFYEASEWHHMLEDLFSKRDTLVFGHETANQAQQRFERTVKALAGATPGDDLIVVTHGTVMSLYLAATHSEDPFTIWKSLEMPDVRIVTLNPPG